ncbi:hypothetical protein [Candidatus Hodarchaeum mangrovi]
MASQYITFMMIFTLGLSLVILTNSMFLTLSEEFRDNLANLEMREILEFLQSQIQQSLQLCDSGNITINQYINLPSLLGQGLRYSIEITNVSNNEIQLHGFTTKYEVNRIQSFMINSKFNLIVANTAFQSVNEILILSIGKIGLDLNIQIT